MSAARLTLALPIDTARMLDHTVTSVQLDSNTFQGTPDDRDVLASYVEGAEDEFRQAVDLDTRVSRVGVEGDRTTFEQLTYSVPGHENFRRRWSGVGGDYLNQEVTKDLENDRLLPFDPSEGDAAYLYRGVSGVGSDSWEDVTDEQGDTWDIVDHRDGTVTFHPIEIDRAMRSGSRGLGVSRSRLRSLRLAISYRHGQLGRGRSRLGRTSLANALDATTTGSVDVDDSGALPRGPASDTAVYLIGREYVTASLDRDADALVIAERGVRGTDAESHDAGDRVQYTPPAFRKAVASRAGMQLIQSGRHSAFMPDAEDAIDKGDMLDQLRETWETTVESAGDAED